MSKEKLNIIDWAAAAEGITTPAMQEAQNESIRNVVNAVSKNVERLKDSAEKSVEHCLVKHTLNGDGLREAHMVMRRLWNA